MHGLIKTCIMEDGKLYMFVSSVTQTNKKVGLQVTMMYLCVCCNSHTPLAVVHSRRLSSGTDSTLEVV